MPVIEASLTLSFLYQYQCYSGSKSETIVQCSACHAIFVFTFYLLYRRKSVLTRMYFQTYFYYEIFQFGKSIFTA